MITDASKIQDVRPISTNIDRTMRIDPYIKEVEQIQIIRRITPALYKQFDENPYPRIDPINLINSIGDTITITADEYNAIFTGGYYNSVNCCADGVEYANGLIAVIGYFVWAKIAMDNGFNVTAFGVVSKTTSTSIEVDEGTRIRVANHANKAGDACMSETIAYLTHLKLLGGCRKPAINTRRFTPVGEILQT